MKNFCSTVSSFRFKLQQSARFQKCFHLQIHKKISANLGIPHPQEKIFVKSRQTSGRNFRQFEAAHATQEKLVMSRQISAIIFFKSRRLVLLYEKWKFKSRQTARNLSQIKKAFGKKKIFNLITYIVPVQRSNIHT